MNRSLRANFAPIVVAIFLLILPALYVGSYCALVCPKCPGLFGVPPCRYRYGGAAAERLFWPLEKIHRQMRPDDWHVIIAHTPHSVQRDEWARLAGFPHLAHSSNLHSYRGDCPIA